MLSAFTARPIIELKARDKSKIETILAHGDRVFVGLNSGALRIYRLNQLPPDPPTHPANGSAQDSTTSAPADPPKPSDDEQSTPSPQPVSKATDLLREVEKFSTRAIEQLAIIREAGTLVSLSNYYVSLHDLQTYEFVETLSRTKNATCFAVTSNVVKDPATGIPEIISRLAVAVKRRLLLWSWHDSELGPDVEEVVLSESIRTVTWASATKLVCGMNAGYVVVDVLTKAVDEIVAPGAIGGSAAAQSRFGAVSSAGMGYMGLGGYMPKPLATKLNDAEMLLAKDINTLFVTDEGKPIEKKQIPWQAAPESIGYLYPYILALQSPTKGSLEVRNPDTLSLLQTIALPGAAQMHFLPPTVSLTHVGKGFHVSSERVVWKMEATDYDAQVEELVRASKFDEAISILNMLEDALLKNKTETLREIKMLKAETLFRQKKYRDSMDLFNEDDVRAPPERVLRLFPPIIAGELSAWAVLKDDESVGDAGSIKTNGDKTKKDDVVEDPSSPAKGAASGLTSYLWRSHRKAPSEAASIPPKPDTAEADDAASIKRKSVTDEHFLEGKDLTNASYELNSYLAGTRTRLQRVLDPATGKLKPRTATNGSMDEAMKSVLATYDESYSQLEDELRRTAVIVDTALFRSYIFSRPTLAGPLVRIANFCDPDVVNEKLLEHNRYNELVDFLYGKKLHTRALELLHRFGTADKPDEAAPSLHGPQRTVLYLQNLPPSEIDLILKYSEWTLRADPELAMEVFVADTENAETLPRDRIVKFLADIDSDLEVRYLEHIITEVNDLTPDFHNRLAELFVKHLKEKKKGEEWDNIMERFVKFLRESRQYSMNKAFGMIPKEDPSFYEAQAVVLSNMGLHEQALKIYVFKMRDYAKAEEYCNRVHKSQEAGNMSPSTSQRTSTDETDESSRPSIYHTLLSLYLNPPPNESTEPNFAPALDLLSKHGARLPASSTLSLIPNSLPVRDLEAYFRGRIRSANSVVNESRIIAGLRATQLFSSQAALLLGDGLPGGQGGRNRRVVITEERLCGVCHKRLGGSVVAVLPDNTVVHYGCLGRATGHRPEAGRVPSWSRAS